MENLEYKEMKLKTKKWLYDNGTSGLELFMKDFKDDEKEYLELRIRIDIAMQILNENGYFNEDEELIEFIEENDALFAVYDLAFRLDLYDLPRAYIILLPIELYENALEFILEKLDELDILEQYYEVFDSQK